MRAHPDRANTGNHGFVVRQQPQRLATIEQQVPQRIVRNAQIAIAVREA